MNLLFLLKKNYNYDYPEYFPLKNSTGLCNSAKFVGDALEMYLCQQVNIETCVDANEIDKYVSLYKPDICFLEAIWVTPEKMLELAILHSNVKFVVRVHSNVPFLATEGVAIGWIKEYGKIPNVSVAFNNKETSEDFALAGIKGFYLPNIYFNNGETLEKYKSEFIKLLDQLLAVAGSLKKYEIPKYIDIGCFGAVRPMKNQLLQAMAAIAFANKHNLTMRFHVNGTRVEQKGDSVLKNIRALFVDVKHTLVEHQWMPHAEFIKLIKYMDIGMQLSLSESFNIVTADFVSQKVPMIVSPDISWMPFITKVGPFNIEKIINRMELVLKYRDVFTTVSSFSLKSYNSHAVKTWSEYLNNN